MAWAAVLNAAKSGGLTRVFDISGAPGDTVANVPHGLPGIPDEAFIVPYGNNGAGVLTDQVRILLVDANDVQLAQTGAVFTVNISGELHVKLKHSLVR